MEHPKDPGLPTPIPDDAQQPPKPADSESDVAIPSEFGQDDASAAPEPTEAQAAAPAPPEPEQAEGTTPPPTEPSAEQPPPQKGTPWGWIIGIGCGCLLLIGLLVVAVVSFGYLGLKAEIDEQAPSPTAIEDAQVEPVPDVSDTDFTGEVPTIDLEDPGLAAAILFGQSRKPAWSVQVATHADDWKTVHLVLGPIGSEFTTWMDLQWDDGAGQYQLVDEGPLGVEDTGANSEVPDIYQPGEEVAKEAALTGTPDWVAKVLRHSSDWKSVVVWTGPPQSEWVFEAKLRWNDNLDCYDIVSHEAIEFDYDQ